MELEIIVLSINQVKKIYIYICKYIHLAPVINSDIPVHFFPVVFLPISSSKQNYETLLCISCLFNAVCAFVCFVVRHGIKK